MKFFDRKFFIYLLIYLAVPFGVWAGTNTLTAAVEGDVISVGTFNQYREALIGSEVVPRNSSGVPQDNISDLGSTSYRWKVGYIAKLIMGAISSAISIEENAGDLEFNVGSGGEYAWEINNSEVARIDASGITRDSFPTTGVLRDLKRDSFTSSGTFNVPNNVSKIFVVAAGGGGGGGGGGRGTGVSPNGAGGGGGGAGAMPYLIALSVTPGGTVTVTVGSGGSGGTGATATTADGSDGGNGGNTTVATGGNTYTFLGGTGGNGGESFGDSGEAGGAGYSTALLSNGNVQIGSGSGGATFSAGSSGQSSIYATGGSGNNVEGGGSHAGGGGGGGGAGVGNGGSGGEGKRTTEGNDGSAGGLTAGGGGGGGSTWGNGGDGGAGGGGFVDIYYVE